MRKIHIIVLLISIFSSFNLFAQKKGEVYSTSDGAIKGHDPVAFFTQSNAVQGDKTITHDWNEATWHFTSKENKEIFAANPEKYAPQYGGYCAYGMSKGYKAPTEIDTWTIVDNKLYFNYNQSVKVEWNKKQAEFIIKADQNWPTAKSK